jgi:hypothetical protein
MMAYSTRPCPFSCEANNMMAFPFRENNDDLSATLTILWHDKVRGNKLRGSEFVVPKGESPDSSMALLNKKTLFQESFVPGDEMIGTRRVQSLSLGNQYVKDMLSLLSAHSQPEIPCKIHDKNPGLNSSLRSGQFYQPVGYCFPPGPYPSHATRPWLALVSLIHTGCSLAVFFLQKPVCPLHMRAIVPFL